MRIAINGMGRIGRLLFKRLLEDTRYNIIAVNDIMAPENLAYLIKYDSVYGTYQQDFILEDNQLIFAGKQIKVFQNSDPSTLPWKDLNIDVVLECSGNFINLEGVERHLFAGAQKVLLSTTGANDIPLKVFGHNQNSGVATLTSLSPGGCMTNCCTHVLYIMNSIGIHAAHINILHSYTSRQALVDAPHKQFRRGRAAAESIIPVDIDLYKSLNRLLPSLQNKIHTSSTRVPVANGAMANFYINLKETITAAEVNKIFKAASQNEYKGIIQYTDDELVSIDIKENTHSCIIDGSQTSVVENQLRIVAWFDNEYGFTSRLIDWLEYWRKNR